MKIETNVITETYYRCPKCRRAYTVLEEAKKCLSNHAYPKEIISYTYSGYGMATEVTIKLSDGSEATYRL